MSSFDVTTNFSIWNLLIANISNKCLKVTIHWFFTLVGIYYCPNPCLICHLPLIQCYLHHKICCYSAGFVDSFRCIHVVKLRILKSTQVDLIYFIEWLILKMIYKLSLDKLAIMYFVWRPKQDLGEHVFLIIDFK